MPVHRKWIGRTAAVALLNRCLNCIILSTCLMQNMTVGNTGIERNTLEGRVLKMDAINSLENILKLILKGDRSELNKSEELRSLQIKLEKTSERIKVDDDTRKHLEKVLTSTKLVLKLFLNNFETFSNGFVECIFHEIQNIFHNVIPSTSPSAFPISNLLNMFNLIVEIIIKHPCDKNFKILENFYMWNMNEIKLKYAEFDDAEFESHGLLVDEIKVHIRIISIIYESICNLKGKVQHENYDVEQSMKGMTTGNGECELFAKLVCGSSEVVMIETLIDVIPKFIEFTKCYAVLQLIWEKICNMYMMSCDVEIRKMLIVFCYLSNFYFAVDNMQMMISVFTNSIYWSFIQDGLLYSDFEVRKRALFLAKTSLNYAAQNAVSFYTYKNEMIGEKGICNLPLIYWEQGMKFDELNEFCIIIEYLEEKQVHIVKPIFSLIENFICNVQEKKVHVTWFLIVIERMINHDNMQIIRQGITSLLKIDLSYYNEKYTMVTAIKLIVRSLNSTQVLLSDLSLLMEEISIFFENCTKHEYGKTFFKILLCEMCDIQWSSEALYVITHCLQSSVKLRKFWSVEEMNLIKKLLLSGTANHYTYIKSGMQCQLLMTAINLMDTCDISVEDVHNFLNSFQGKILQRKTLLWDSVAKWMGNFFDAEDAQKFINNSLERRNFGRTVVLLCDSYAHDVRFLRKTKNVLENISTLFVDVHARPYCDSRVQDGYLTVICDVMRESCGDPDFCNIFRPFIPDIVLYIKLQLESKREIGDFHSCKALVECLCTILNDGGQRLNTSPVINTWFEEIIKNLVSKSDSRVTPPIQKYVQIELVNMMMDHYAPRETGMIETYLQTELNTPLMKTREDGAKGTKDLQMWGRMNSEFLRGKWRILSKLRASPLETLLVPKSNFISLCFEALDLSGYTVLFPLMSTIGKAMSQLLNEPRLVELIDAIWRLVMERKKNEEYSNLLQWFVEIVFQLQVVLNGGDEIRKTLINYSQTILSESATAQAAIILVTQIQNIGFHEGGIYLLKELLPRSLIFGQHIRKDERLVRDLCYIVEKSGLSPLTNCFRCGNEVRARSVQFILTLNPAVEVHSRFCEDLFESLRVLEERSCKNKTRYFSDSHVHRVKQRLLQALLLLEPFMMKDGSNELWNWLSEKMLLENNQTSVRYLQEWLMLKMINRNRRFRNAVWSYFDESLEKRSGSLCSFISVIYHSVKCVNRDEMAVSIERAVNVFLPYCMAQHFNVRLYAQITLEKLLETAENHGLKNIAEQYALVRRSLNLSIERGGNAVKVGSKLREDFYITAFDPVEHYSLRTIFFELPRLAGVNPEELIPESMFRKIGITDEKCFIRLTNESNALEKFSPGKWTADRSNEGHFTEESKTVNDFQKKIIPVKYVTPNDLELLPTACGNSKMLKKKDGFVVVASLIDRMPNLGGLSRTCEVFGACELVIGSLKYMEDKQFQSLSVTAEKWITVTEVKPFYLADYIIKMKRNGYTVMAAEQTVNSKPLQSVKFPEKCLLLLGNEKEGIPPTLLPLMDICIEIPQVGVIRSLNVHVTGALFLWEYAKQHHI